MSDNMLSLSGNLGSDPEIRYTPAGAIVVVFTLAAEENARRGGISSSRTSWHRCIATDENAEKARNLKKGSRVLVEGESHERTWRDRYRHEHTLIEFQIRDMYVSGAETPVTAAVENKPRSPLEAARAAGLFGKESES